MANSKIGVYGAFYFFGGIVTLALPIVYFVLPETKDLSLEIIQNYFTPVKTIFYVDINENWFFLITIILLLLEYEIDSTSWIKYFATH